MKPIKKGTVTNNNFNKAALLGSIILTGAIAMTASGCTAEIKTADGTPIGSVYFDGDASAISNIIEINSTGAEQKSDLTGRVISEANADITEPSVKLPEDNFDPKNDPVYGENDNDNGAIELPEDDFDPKNDPVYGENDNDDGADSYICINGGTFSTLAEGTVLKFSDDGKGGYYLTGETWSVKIVYLASSKVVYTVNGSEFVEDVDFRGFSTPYLLKANGQIYIYWNVCNEDCYDVRVYNLGDSRITYAGCKENLYVQEIESTDSFLCEEFYVGKGPVRDIYRYYYVSSNGLPQQADHMCHFGTYALAVTYRDLSGNIVKDGAITNEIKDLYQGTKVYLIAADENHHLMVKTMDGEYVLINIEGASEGYYYRGYDRWFNDVLSDLFN